MMSLPRAVFEAAHAARNGTFGVAPSLHRHDQHTEYFGRLFSRLGRI